MELAVSDPNRRVLGGGGVGRGVPYERSRSTTVEGPRSTHNLGDVRPSAPPPLGDVFCVVDCECPFPVAEPALPLPLPLPLPSPFSLAIEVEGPEKLTARCDAVDEVDEIDPDDGARGANAFGLTSRSIEGGGKADTVGAARAVDISSPNGT